MVLDRESQLELVVVFSLDSSFKTAANDFFHQWQSHFQNNNYEFHLADTSFLEDQEIMKRSSSFLQKKILQKKEELSFLKDSRKTLYFVIAQNQMLITEEGLVLEFVFESSSLHFRSQVQSKNDLLLKASGIFDQKGMKIADLTAGTLADSFLLAQYGAQVFAWERTSFLFPLLDHALKVEQQRQASWPSHQQFAKNITLQFADAKELLNQSELFRSMDTFVFDPMFPQTKKTALPRKEMQVFRRLVGPDLDAESMVTIFGQALHSEQRLIVKRPIESTSITWMGPQGRFIVPRRSVRGNLVRWDIYFAE